MRWTPEADDIVRRVYPAHGSKATRDEIARRLGGDTTPAAVSNRASKLGVRRARGDQVRDRMAKVRVVATEAAAMEIVDALEAADGLELGRVSTYPAREDGKVRIYVDVEVK